ncbi:hypothetical protein FEM03_07315 [Phragmitibacter flavus]|uniref:Uncharacterized protein n=1 Tax=Phragmitibacter flavus TaxID=2576071 RepID=A0A5R8KGA2_9BACT|nr:hypothetical protein [Phragmitibacter flavus]TLD71332.1 hypothetical protein FEM03_07315 [Phragmitibacter flavus]
MPTSSKVKKSTQAIRKAKAVTPEIAQSLKQVEESKLAVDTAKEGFKEARKNLKQAKLASKEAQKNLKVLKKADSGKPKTPKKGIGKKSAKVNPVA